MKSVNAFPSRIEMTLEKSCPGETHQVLISLFRLIEGENLRVDDGMNVVCLNGSNHVLHHGPRAHHRTAHDAHLVQALKDALGDILATEESDDADNTLELDGFEALLEAVCPADLDDVVNAHAPGGQIPSRLPPARVLLVVDHMIGAELPQPFGFGRGRGRRDHGRPCRFGKLGLVSMESGRRQWR